MKAAYQEVSAGSSLDINESRIGLGPEAIICQNHNVVPHYYYQSSPISHEKKNDEMSETFSRLYLGLLVSLVRLH